MEFLPATVQIQIAKCLSLKDAVALSRCSRALHRAIPLSGLPPRLESKGFEWDGGMGDKFFRAFIITTTGILQNRTHSVVVSCHWSDQGWGNRESRLAVVAFPSPKAGESDKDLERRMPRSILPQDWQRGKWGRWGHWGRFVYMTPNRAPHQRAPLQFSIMPRRGSDEVYYVYAKPGGSERMLTVDNLYYRRVIVDKEDRSFARIGRHLTKTDTKNPFETELLVKVVRLLVQSLQENDNGAYGTLQSHADLVSFLEGYGFSVDKSSLMALEEILEYRRAQHALKERLDELFPFRNRPEYKVGGTWEAPSSGF